VDLMRHRPARGNVPETVGQHDRVERVVDVDKRPAADGGRSRRADLVVVEQHVTAEGRGVQVRDLDAFADERTG